MTTFRPKAGSINYGARHGHNRHWKNRDTLFTDEANAHTDWIPVTAGQTINVMAHAANLRRKIENGVASTDDFTVVRLNSAPRGSVSLKYKLGGEEDEHGALIAGPWTDTPVVFSQPVMSAGFVRLEFGCMQGQLLSEHTDEVGQSLTPNGMFVSLEVVR